MIVGLENKNLVLVYFHKEPIASNLCMCYRECKKTEKLEQIIFLTIVWSMIEPLKFLLCPYSACSKDLKQPRITVSFSQKETEKMRIIASVWN